VAKGHKTGGRKPGSRNKFTTEVRTAILEAFVQLGGSSYLVRVGNENPAAFCSLLGKILPHELATETDAPVPEIKFSVPERNSNCTLTAGNTLKYCHRRSACMCTGQHKLPASHQLLTRASQASSPALAALWAYPIPQRRTEVPTQKASLRWT